MRPHRIPRDAPLCRCTPMCRWCSSWAPAKPSRRRAPQAGRYTNLIEARTPPRVAAQRTSDGPFAATSVTPRSVRHGNLQHSQVLASRYGHQQHRIFHHPQLLRRGAWWGWPGPLTTEQSNKVELRLFICYILFIIKFFKCKRHQFISQVCNGIYRKNSISPVQKTTGR